MESMVVDGDIIYSDALRRNCITVEKSGLAQKTLEYKRIASGTTSGDKLKCRNVSFGICFSRIEFPLRMDNSTDWLSWTGTAIFLLSYMLYAEVLKENAYLSRTVEVQKGQKVVDTGLYGIVRHPMYTITIFLFLSMPLVLGSLISFVVFLAYPVIIAKRIINEEAVLEKDLDGYTEYKKKVKYKIIPYLW